jgi:PKHD-type hydroxylase
MDTKDLSQEEIEKLFAEYDKQKEEEKKAADKSVTWVFDLDYVEPYAWYEKVFTPEECAMIIEICKQTQMQEATINKKVDEPEAVTDDYRKSNIAWVGPSADMLWVYQRLTDVIRDMNEKYYRFDLHGFLENLQFTEYNAPSGKYDWHIDKSYGKQPRKLSMVLQLTDPDEYEGGELQARYGKSPETLPMGQGTLITFPSYVVHRVTEVTKGQRHSLVGWIGGKPFK